MKSVIDIEHTFEDMIAKGYVCEDLIGLVKLLRSSGRNEIELCGISNPKAPDPYIFLKSKMDYELVTRFVDESQWLKDDRIRARKVNRVFCTNPEHFSAVLEYDWKSKNDP